ncbi:MAG TPA: M20 family metallopeptidase [Phycisphaerae bacterium]|nr:M20 family metallopeptidase [Phycisphaerae bacterium]
MASELSGLIDGVLAEVVAFRRDLHMHPELSRRERETSRRIRERLAKLPGLKVFPPLMETDVVALLNADQPGHCLALRADIDALPIQEESPESEVPYRSTVPGVMHACGHDGHTANLLGTAMVLSKMADKLPGRVLFVFQPDEEDESGARVLCERGLFELTKVDAIIGLHGWPQRPVGSVSMRYGPAMASSNSFFITIRGVGAHGAYPHRGVDPIVVAAHIVMALQSIMGRSVNPIDAGVVTVGAIHAGTATNIIPPECEMKGTLRHLDPEVGQLLRERLVEIVENTAKAHRAAATVRFGPAYPSVSNEEATTRLVEVTARELLGTDNVHIDDPPSMGVEDFAYYLQHVPGMMFRVGVRPKHLDTYPALHNPRFNFNDEALPVGMRMFGTLAERYLQEKSTRQKVRMSE